MKIQKESLEELKTKDPETYEKINAASKSIFGFIAEDNINVRMMEGIIQSEIQRACEKRGWYYFMSYEGEFWAQINKPYSTGAKHSKDSPSNALLSAYLGALETDASR